MSEPLAEIDEARLRAVANAVGDRPRDWEWTGVGEHGYPQQVISQGNVHLIAEVYESPDHPSSIAEYIATFDPKTVLALLDLAFPPVTRCPTCINAEGYDRLSGPCPTCNGDGVLPPGQQDPS